MPNEEEPNSLIKKLFFIKKKSWSAQPGKKPRFQFEKEFPENNLVKEKGPRFPVERKHPIPHMKFFFPSKLK